MNKSATYVTTYCNFPHKLHNGMPVGHQCYVLPPQALKLEKEGKYDEAIKVLTAAQPLRVSRGTRK